MGLDFLYNIPFSGVLIRSSGAEFLRPDALPGVNHMRRMKCKTVLTIINCLKNLVFQGVKYFLY